MARCIFFLAAFAIMPLHLFGDEAKPKSEELRKELLRRFQEDQAARKELIEWMKKQGATDARKVKEGEFPLAKKLREIDQRNTDRMKEIILEHGWPGKSLVGVDGANAAWLLVQHADHDRPFQKLCLKLMGEAFRKSEVSGKDLAYLTDRVRVGEQKKQVYGTQMHTQDGKLVPQPIEDEANVDKRRKEVGLSPLAEYIKMAREAYGQKE